MSYEEIKQEQYQIIKEWFKTMSKDTKISFNSYLDFSYVVGGVPQINHIFFIKSKDKQINYNRHSKFLNMEWLPKNINIEWLIKYIVNKPNNKYIKITKDYNKGLNFYKFDNVPLSEFIED